MKARLDQLDRLGELRAVVAVALIGLVTQREVGVQRHAQRQPDQPQISPAALRMPALRDRVALVGGVDERRKVRGVIDQRAQLDPVALDRAPHDLGLGLRDRLIGDDIHCIPEPLRGQRPTLGGQQPDQCGASVPVTELALGARLARPIDRRQHDHLPDRQTLPASAGRAERPVDRLGHLKLPAQPQGGGDRAEAPRDHRLGVSRPRQPLLDVLRAPQIHLAHHLHPATHPGGLPQVVVRPAVEDLLRKTRHNLGHTLEPTPDGKYRKASPTHDHSAIVAGAPGNDTQVIRQIDAEPRLPPTQKPPQNQHNPAPDGACTCPSITPKPGKSR